MSEENSQKDEEENSPNDGKIVVRLRLTRAEKDAITAAGRKKDRSLAAELAYRIRGGEPPAQSPFAGWLAADAQTFQNFGEIAARLLADVTLAAGTKTSLRDRLGYMREVLPMLLDELGATHPPGHVENYFQRRARDALTGSFMQTATENLGAQYAETDLARRFRDLKTIVEDGAQT